MPTVCLDFSRTFLSFFPQVSSQERKICRHIGRYRLIVIFTSHLKINQLDKNDMLFEKEAKSRYKFESRTVVKYIKTKLNNMAVNSSVLFHFHSPTL